MLRRILRIASATLLLIAAMPSAHAAWVESTVADVGTAASESASIAISPDARPYVAWIWGGDDLFWAKRTSTGWTSTQVRGQDTFIACNDHDHDWIGPSAAFKPDGTPQIATACIAVGGGAKVYYTIQKTTGWKTRYVGSGPFGTCESSATDIDLINDPVRGRPVVVMADRCTRAVTGFFLRHGTWERKTLVPGSSPSFYYPAMDLSVDPASGKLAMALNGDVYGRNELSLYTFSWNGTTRSKQDLSLPGSEAPYGEPSLGFHPDGTGYVAFQAGSEYGTPQDEAYGYLALAERTGGTWGSPWVVDESQTMIGAEPDLQLEGEIIHVTYQDVTNEDLRYGTSSDGHSWALVSIQDPDDAGYFPSLAVLGSGKALVVHWDATDTALLAVRGP